eukprot:CAMPEP_0119329600 /NCGR_PEP_ID=MMETSP1333-20130426/76220_1 /TAXON_ID=418940 /ORGANISM="Scyphosphaera apsteinii, Strain RCC1455" /LENGTH=383 /DNA_ID=CAMNT_0007338759 /DNA_START=87 /DNA_END=1234 /DNA_ORIENTATION=+
MKSAFRAASLAFRNSLHLSVLKARHDTSTREVAALAVYLTSISRSNLSTPGMAIAAPVPSAGTYSLVVGILSTEHRQAQRQRLRSFYNQFTHNVLVRFVLDAWWMKQHSMVLVGDELGVPALPQGTGFCLRKLIMARKTLSWWQRATEWNASYYAKTDDDAIIDLEQLLVLLNAAPHGPLYGGVVRFSCINTTSLTCPSCFFAFGAVGALKLMIRNRASSPACDFGPFPFALGPLQILSQPVCAWAASRVAQLNRRLQTCPMNEDALFGSLLAFHPNLTLLNLEGTLGNFDVQWLPHKLWHGAPSLLAHKISTSEAWSLATRDFIESKQTNGGLATYCTRRLDRKWQQHARRIYCHGEQLRLLCKPWSQEFASLRMFPCCRVW